MRHMSQEADRIMPSALSPSSQVAHTAGAAWRGECKGLDARIASAAAAGPEADDPTDAAVVILTAECRPSHLILPVSGATRSVARERVF